jgi:hypothetical protein
LNKLAVVALLLLPFTLFSQNQLVLINNDKVVMRYRVGDDVNYKRKNGEKVSGFIVEVNDSTIIASNDTVATHQIEKVYFPRGNFLNLVGGFLVTGGALLFIIDQVNTVVVDGDKASSDERVSRITLISLSAGLPLMLMKKQAHRVGFKKRLRIVNKESPFYYSEVRLRKRGYVSPGIPRN